MLGDPITKWAMGIHPAIENAAGEVLIVATDCLQYRREEPLHGRPTRIPESVDLKTSEGVAKSLGFGTVFEGPMHYALAELLVQKVEDLVGTSRFGLLSR